MITREEGRVESEMRVRKRIKWCSSNGRQVIGIKDSGIARICRE